MDTIQIEFVNVRTYPGDKDEYHYCGRPSTLGNPFTVKQHGHGKAIELYRDWLNHQWMFGNQKVINKLKRLATEAKHTGHLRLGCWCHPNPCHTEVIADAIKGIIRRNEV